MHGFTVGQKLWAGFATMLGLLLLQGFASVAAIGTFQRVLDSSIKRGSASAELVRDLHESVANMKAYAKMTQFTYALDQMTGHKSAGTCASCHRIAAPDTAQHEFAAIADHIRPKLRALGEGMTLEEKQSLDVVDKGVTEWAAVFGDYLSKASARQFDAGHSIITDRMEPIRERIEQATKELVVVEAQSLERSQAESVASVKQKALWLFGLQLTILLPTVFLAWRFIRRVTTQLRVLREAARYLAAGDVDGAENWLASVGL